jgi:hypothetical protein
MRRSLGIVALLTACGGPSAPPAVTPEPVVGPAPATCADVGVILRGPAGGNDEAGGPAREAAIAKACEIDRWPAAVIACVASTPQPRTCLDQLTEAQASRLEDAMVVWGGDDGDHDDDDGDHHDHDHDADAAPHLSCADAIGDAGVFPPTLGDKAPERAWTVAQRRRIVVEHCTHEHWSEATKQCLQAAGDAAAVAACLAADTQIALGELTKELGEVDRLAGKIAKAMRSPSTITCKHVVATHYGDARWKARLGGHPPAERKQIIAASRDRLHKACSAEPWEARLRACIVVGGAELCLRAYGLHGWGYPATGTVTSTGIAACDAYGELIERLLSCPAIPADSREAMRRHLEQLTATLAAVPDDQRGQVATTCDAGAEAVKQALAATCP